MEENEDYLYDADPDCDHEIIEKASGGIECTKCEGWFCY